MSLRHGLAVALAVLFALPGVARATEAVPPPGATGEGVLTFSAPVEQAFLEVEVRDARGRIVSGRAERRPGDPTVVLVPLATAVSGTYRAAWRALSIDGQVVRGEAEVAGSPGADGRVSLAENVRARAEARPLGVAARLLLLASPVVLLGIAALVAWVVGPAWRSVPQDTPEVLARSRWRPAWWAAVGAGGLGLLLALIAQLRALGAGAGDLGPLLVDTRWGAALLVQACALGAAVVAGVAYARRDRPGGRGVRAADAALGLPPAVALGALAWAGHASSGTDRAIGIGADVLHGWATALWLGGLVGLMTLVVPVLRRVTGEARTRLAAPVVVRFSTLAVGAVAVLAVTGVYRALAELSSLEDLVETPYGKALLVKLVVFAVMLAVGAYNRFTVHPRLERAALGLEPTDRGAAGRLRTSVGVELVLALGVMTAVAVLGDLPPPA